MDPMSEQDAPPEVLLDTGLFLKTADRRPPSIVYPTTITCIVSDV